MFKIKSSLSGIRWFSMFEVFMFALLIFLLIGLIGWQSALDKSINKLNGNVLKVQTTSDKINYEIVKINCEQKLNFAKIQDINNFKMKTLIEYKEYLDKLYLSNLIQTEGVVKK